MKRLIFILLMSMVLVGFVGAEDCQLATPRYGVVECRNAEQTETRHSNFENFDGEWSINEINCLSNCQLTSEEDITIDCESVPWDEKKVIKDGVEKTSFPISWNKGDSLVVKGKCTTLFSDTPVPSNADVEYQQDKIMLYEGWAGSLPNTPITGTEDCILNKDINEEPNIDSYLDASTGSVVNKESSSYSSLNQFPNNWKITDHYIFIKDWQTGIADISLTYDKQNKAYWCGGQYGSRKIYDVKQIISNTGNCYAIPQSIYLSNIECCFPSDCVDTFGAEYTCNPDNWKCEKTKPCNSQLDCESVFGEGVCQDNKINQWVCDLTKKWGDYLGTCIHSSKEVSDCPSDCNTKEYYNEEQGVCLPRAGLETQEEDSTIPITGAVIGTSRTGTIILVIFLILIAGSIGYFIYNKNKTKGVKQQVKEDIKTGGKYCTKCGSLLGGGNKFCTKCGRESK